jgi:hypothetical protein
LIDEQKRCGVILSWEALDHLCGLAVESGMKALMVKAKLVSPEPSGDFPPDATGRRPHIDQLWEIFMANAGGRATSGWIKRIGGGKGSPANVFQTWRSEHRYAPDGTVSEAVMLSRLQILKQLKNVAIEEGL